MSEPEQPQSGQEHVLPSVPDVLLSTVQLMVTLAADAIARRENLEEAELAIDTLRALMPQVQRVVPAEAVGPFREMLAELQLAYVDALEAPAAAAPQEQDKPSEPVVETPPRPKIWTPEGEV